METKLDKFIKEHSQNEIKKMDFVSYIYYLMKIKNLNPQDVYKPVDISRQMFSKIISNQVEPSKETCIKLALGLHCSNHECKTLLKKKSYTLSSSSKFSLVIRYCFENGIYDLLDVNNLLDSKGLKTL